MRGSCALPCETARNDAHAELGHALAPERFGLQPPVGLVGDPLRVFCQPGGGQIVRRLVRKIARTIRPARDDDSALGFRLNRVVPADEDKVVHAVLPPLGLPEPRVVAAQDQPVDDRTSLLRRRQRQGVVQHPRDRPADRLHEPGDPAGRGPDGVGVDLLAEAADGDALRARLGGQVEEHRLARLGLEAVRVEERPHAPAEITGRLGSVANRERKNLGLDGKGVGARYRNLHRTGRC